MASVAAGSLSCRKDSLPPSEWKITVVVFKQSGAGLEPVQCHATLTLEALTNQIVTSVGVGGAGVTHVQSVASKLYKTLVIYMYLLQLEKPIWGHSCYQSYDCHS